jgi:hypothetical protein
MILQGRAPRRMAQVPALPMAGNAIDKLTIVHLI